MNPSGSISLNSSKKRNDSQTKGVAAFAATFYRWDIFGIHIFSTGDHQASSLVTAASGRFRFYYGISALGHKQYAKL